MNATVDTKPKFPGLISLVLVTILGLTLAKLMWLIVSPDKVALSQIQTNSNTTAKQKDKVNYGKLIANHHLFGTVAIKKAAIKKAPPKPKVAVVAPTKLNLKLHGIIAYKNKKQGFALISTDGGTQKVFGKGDTIQKGVTVSEVSPTKVVISNNGTIEELLLPVKKGKSKPRKRVASSFELGANSRKAPPLAPSAQGIAPTQQQGTFNLSQFRQEAMSSGPQKLLEIATPSPATKNGQFIGFRLQPGRLRKAFRELGFRPNDIVTEVNGIILDDANKAAMVLANLSQAGQISLKVLRGNRVINIQHSF